MAGRAASWPSSWRRKIYGTSVKTTTENVPGIAADELRGRAVLAWSLWNLGFLILISGLLLGLRSYRRSRRALIR